jgi:hypothetical protein
MNKNIFWFLTVVYGFVILAPTIAKAESWGALTGVHKYVIESSSSASTTKSKSEFSSLFGLAFYHSTYPVELDVFYTTKKLDTDYTENSLQLPFFYRSNFTKELKLGVGGFFDYYLGENLGRQKLDMGPAISLQYQIPVGKAFLVLDARYLYGMLELPGNSRDINLIIGIVFK